MDSVVGVAGAILATELITTTQLSCHQLLLTGGKKSSLVGNYSIAQSVWRM